MKALYIRLGLIAASILGCFAAETEPLYLEPIKLDAPHFSKDPLVKIDYDIVYVRAPRRGDQGRTYWTEIAHPALMDSGADLMLLHPDGSEELLVSGGADGSITDPFVSFDGEWCFYSHIKGLKGTGQHGPFPSGGADIYKFHVKSRRTVRLTHQEFTPNLGAAAWSRDFRTSEEGKTHLSYGVLNMGPCPLPGGRVIFVSNRNAFKPPKHPSPCLQLFVMDDDGSNVEMIGYLNVGMALHPTVLTDGRVMFSSLESQGLRSSIMWGLWSIHPDGSNWGPIISAFLPGEGAPNAFHFQTQLSDGNIVAEEYYNQNNSGFGAYLKLQSQRSGSYPPFGSAGLEDARNRPLRFGRHDNGKPSNHRMPFTPDGLEVLTRFAKPDDGQPIDRFAARRIRRPLANSPTPPARLTTIF
jgi:hypothetical protein